MRIPYGFLCLALTLTATLGCVSESSQQHQQDVEAFVGTWSWDDGSSGTITCPSDTASVTISGNESFAEGASADLVLVSDECNLEFDVHGSTAEIVAAQSCESEEGTFYWSNWTFDRSADRLTSEASGTYEVNAGGECTMSFSGSLERVGG